MEAAPVEADSASFWGEGEAVAAAEVGEPVALDEPLDERSTNPMSHYMPTTGPCNPSVNTKKTGAAQLLGTIG